MALIVSMESASALRSGHGPLRHLSDAFRLVSRKSTKSKGNGGRKTRNLGIKKKLFVAKVAGVDGVTVNDYLESANDHPDVVHLGGKIGYEGIHHVGLLCKNLEVSLDFYQRVLGLTLNKDRPNKKLPYRGAWLWIGSEMIHLMELPNPDPSDGRPEHGGRDRHFCVAINNIEPLVKALDEAKVEYTRSMSGRPAIFFRDPDMNCLECFEIPSTT